VNEPARQPVGFSAETYHPRLSRLFQAGGDVSRDSIHIVQRQLANAALPENDLSVVDADPGFHELCSLAPEPIADRETSQAGSDRMIFARRRGAEDRHNAVTAAVDDAFEAFNFLDHAMNRRTEEVCGSFRLQMLHKFGRALDVGEQQRHATELSIHFVDLA